jgi:hypothetical protein
VLPEPLARSSCRPRAGGPGRVIGRSRSPPCVRCGCPPTNEPYGIRHRDGLRASVEIRRSHGRSGFGALSNSGRQVQACTIPLSTSCRPKDDAVDVTIRARGRSRPPSGPPRSRTHVAIFSFRVGRGQGSGPDICRTSPGVAGRRAGRVDLAQGQRANAQLESVEVGTEPGPPCRSPGCDERFLTAADTTVDVPHSASTGVGTS